MSNTPQDFCRQLVQHFRSLAPLLEEHLADYDEVLPHVFMADVTRYVLSGGPQRRELVSGLEEAFRTKGEEMQNLIAVSFVENLETKEELERAVEGVQADELRAEWRRQQGG